MAPGIFKVSVQTARLIQSANMNALSTHRTRSNAPPAIRHSHAVTICASTRGRLAIKFPLRSVAFSAVHLRSLCVRSLSLCVRSLCVRQLARAAAAARQWQSSPEQAVVTIATGPHQKTSHQKSSWTGVASGISPTVDARDYRYSRHCATTSSSSQDVQCSITPTLSFVAIAPSGHSVRG
jgi:hypothetical protein